MKLTKVGCPHCRTVLKSALGVQAGQKIVCPKCREHFAAASPGVARNSPPPEEDEGLPARRSAARSTKRAMRSLGDDDKADRRNRKTEPQAGFQTSPRTKKRKKRNPQAAPSLLVRGLLIGGAVLLLVGGAAGLYFMFRKAPASHPSPVAAKPVDNPDVKLSAVDVPEGWGEIVSEQGGFRAVMPKPFIERARTMGSPVGPVKDYQYLRETDGKFAAYVITYADFSPAQLEKMSLEQIIDAGRDGILKTRDGQLEADKRIERNGCRGRELIISVPDGNKLLIHYVIADQRLYTLTVVGTNAQLDSKEVRLFLDSFRFTDAKR